MCTVDKILIKGIRSFSPDNNFRIEFYKPLTLIVGSNGAGKTTIIECLRQATTGELPPNTRQGQGFIHDPKIAGETEVKAQIRLQFRTALGQPITVIRSFQLVQKKTQLQFKTLDSTVTTTNKDTGERQAMTYRCADLDKIVPSLMGVSKAVLENVIFVHQEESNWPLAEGRVLKDKFDDIFAATKYTKALEALRKLRTEKAQSIKEMKLSIETLRAVKDQASYHQRDRDSAQTQANAIKARMKELEDKIQPLEARRAELDAKLSAIADLRDQLEPKRAQLDMMARQNRERQAKLMSDGTEDYEESAAELRQGLADLDGAAAALRAKRGAREGEVRERKMAQEALADQYNQLCMRHGKLAGEASAHASNLAERDRCIRAAATSLALALPPEASFAAGSAGPGGAGTGALPAAAAEAFRASVAAKVLELQGGLHSLKSRNRAQDASLSAAVDSVTTQLTRAQEGLRLKRDQMRANQASMDAAHVQISSIPVSASRCAELSELAKEAEARVQAKQDEERSSGLDTALAEQRSSLEGLARRISALRAEREAAAAANESGTRLRVKRADLAAKEEQINNMLASRRGRLLALLGLPPNGQLPEPGQLRGAADGAVAAQRREHEQRAREMRDAQSKEQVAKGSLDSLSHQLGSKEAEAGRLREQLRAGIDAAMAATGAAAAAAEEDFNNSLAKAEQESTKLQGKMSDASAMMRVLSNMRSLASTEPHCPICRRDFVGQDRERCVTHIDTELHALPSMLASREAQLARVRAQVEALRALQPAWLRYEDLNHRELPALRARLEAAKGQHAALAAQASELVELYAVADVEVAEAGRMVAEVVWPLDRLGAEAAQLRRDIHLLEMSTGGSQGARTVSDVDGDLEAAERARASHEAARDELARKAARLKDEVVAAQRAHMAAQQEALQAAMQLRTVVELQDKIRELEAANTRLQGELEAAAAAVAPLEEERRQQAKRREEARAAAEREEREAEAALREAERVGDQLAAKMRPVAEYEARGRAAELARVAADLERLRADMDAAAGQVAAMEQDMKSIDTELSERDKLRRSIQDVLELREAMEAEQALRGELQRLQERVAQVGDGAALQASLLAAMNDMRSFNSQLDQLRGHLAAQLQVADKAQRELADERYRGIDGRFKAALVAQKTTEMANADLDKYYKALEKALLSFHTSKMADINKMIKEMWQKTYRGQDIDYIQIRADTEGAGARSYNYRVVMFSGSAELEMRGRCSAGQKVLACLIIRLALAETFCLNCGILALDEPTTNLDAANSASLAEALRSVMVARAGQENFQLIVITHDERFARAIGTREYTETMWRVTKDAAQHTLVEPEEVLDE